MSGICDTCRREPCPMRFDGCKTCDVYEGGESNYDRLFGTPERTAKTMVDMCEGGTFDDCGGCPAALAKCKLGDYDALLEWLEGESDD